MAVNPDFLYPHETGALYRPHNMLDVSKIWPDMPREDYLEHLPGWARGIPAYNQAVQEQVRRGINAGELVGALAIRAILGMGVVQQVYHGSNVLPENLEGGVLQPRQPYWRYGHEAPFRDGQPAICFTPDRHTATTIALLHPHGSTAEGVFLAYTPTPEGKLYRTTTTHAIQEAAGKTACLYTIHSMQTWDCLTLHRGPEPEYRKLAPTPYVYAARIQADILPPDLLVVDTDDRNIFDDITVGLREGANPLDLRRKYDVDILPFGGAWDVTHHPLHLPHSQKA